MDSRCLQVRSGTPLFTSSFGARERAQKQGGGVRGVGEVGGWGGGALCSVCGAMGDLETRPFVPRF